ncbi:hypothetical protein, partial [Mycolicibacterium obuense]|uniref:hypothetical protein n=1 Tax=Mycolicibacterium obuense TaxID=1807 RepID=UPI0019D715AB
LAGHSDDVSSELGRKRLRHEIDPSSKDESSQVRSQPNWGQSLPFGLHDVGDDVVDVVLLSVLNQLCGPA